MPTESTTNPPAGEPAKPQGVTKNLAYRSWSSMIQRCINPNLRCYHRYGGRGIKVCERWRWSFVMFLEDMGPRPSKEHSIDRYPDKDGDYEPGNCRWATLLEQNNNRRPRSGAMTITFRGKTLTIKQWAVTLDLLPASLAQRFQQGWGIREALTTPALTTRSRRNKKRRKPGLDGLYDVVDPERTKPK